jgi:hypothetical protein
MSDHHLSYGKIVDYITGHLVEDTDDERARQKIARFLTEEKGYLKADIHVQRKISLLVDGNQAETAVDFIIRMHGKSFAVVIFGPGSIVTRERSTLASARLVENYQVPYAIITNGKDAEIMETQSGKVIAKGLHAIWHKTDAQNIHKGHIYQTVSDERKEKEKRILYVYEVLAEKECNEFKCTFCAPPVKQDHSYD